MTVEHPADPSRCRHRDSHTCGQFLRVTDAKSVDFSVFCRKNWPFQDLYPHTRTDEARRSPLFYISEICGSGKSSPQWPDPNSDICHKMEHATVIDVFASIFAKNC
jgi:hypothetical protein